MTKKPLQDEGELTYSNIPYGRALIHSSKFALSTSFEPRGDQALPVFRLAEAGPR